MKLEYKDFLWIEICVLFLSFAIVHEIIWSPVYKADVEAMTHQSYIQQYYNLETRIKVLESR